MNADDPARAAGDAPQGQSVHARLLDEIRLGQIIPGSRLRETDLAERLGISRTPVREAIRMLEADGLVVHIPRQGATLRRLSYAEVMELYEMRVVLEGTAARLAARSASEIELAELDAIHAEMQAAAADPALVSRLNRQFHASLLNAAKNRFLSRAMASLQRTLLILGPTTLRDATRVEQAGQEHAAILATLRSRDGTAAENAMRRHIEAAQQMRLRLLRSEGALEPDDNEGVHD